jgi:uncharacterized repeat protein (TIGR01451 family)
LVIAAALLIVCPSSVAHADASATADLGITNTVSPPPYGTGRQVTWTIVVTNNSGASASGVIVSEVGENIPTTGLTFTPSQGTCGPSQIPPPPVATFHEECVVGTLAGGATATIIMRATLPSTPGIVRNGATVFSPDGDSNPANDSASSMITVIDAALVPTLDTKSLLLLAVALATVAAFMMQRD